MAVEPLRKAILCHYRRIRLYSFWRWLRSATPELTLTPTTSRWRDLFDTDSSWEVLHQHVIEVRDSTSTSMTHGPSATCSPGLTTTPKPSRAAPRTRS
ncbi:DUF6545 domain-containing protein [Amycolatopsis sp. NPDC054798]